MNRRDYISIGATPADEACAQVGRDDYHQRSRVELHAFIAQLRRAFGPEPEGARLQVKTSPHDFGTYGEVVCYYDDGNPEAVDYALRCEGQAPGEWDQEARAELQKAGFAVWLQG